MKSKQARRLLRCALDRVEKLEQANGKLESKFESMAARLDFYKDALAESGLAESNRKLRAELSIANFRLAQLELGPAKTFLEPKRAKLEKESESDQEKE